MPAQPEGFFRRKMRELGEAAILPSPILSSPTTMPPAKQATEEVMIRTPRPENTPPSDSFLCPICTRTIPFGGDQDRHVEECLSRQAIKAMLRGESDGEVHKRKSSATNKHPVASPPPKKQRKTAARKNLPESPTAKKGRKNIASSNTIDSYFKR